MEIREEDLVQTWVERGCPLYLLPTGEPWVGPACEGSGEVERKKWAPVLEQIRLLDGPRRIDDWDSEDWVEVEVVRR